MLQSSPIPLDIVTCPTCRLRQFVRGDTCPHCHSSLGLTYYAFQLPSRCAQRGLPDRSSIRRFIGILMRRLRLRLGISQSVLATRVEQAQRTRVTRMEKGQSMPNLRFLLLAAIALDIDRIVLRVRRRKLDLSRRK